MLSHQSHSVGQNAFHFVWKPKYSWDVFKFPWMQKDCETILREAAERYGCFIHALNVQPDHVHLFVELPASLSVSKALQLFKGYSSYKLFAKHKWLRSYFRKGHFWSPGKFFRSVGNVTAETIKHYSKESQGGLKFESQNSLSRYSAL